MKKVISLILLVTMVIGMGAMVYADTETVCELDPEVWATMFELKKDFLADQVSEGILTQIEADELVKALEAKEGIGVLRELSFGIWLKDSDKYDEVYDLLPHKGSAEGFARMDKSEMHERGAKRNDSGEFQGRGNRFRSSDTE